MTPAQERANLADSIVAYMRTRATPFNDWEEAVREGVRLLTTEARWETIRALGGKRWVEGEQIDPFSRTPFWVVPDE